VSDQPRQRPPVVGVEAAVAAIGLLAVLAAGLTWAGARLAASVSGGSVTGGPTDWLVGAVRLTRRPSEPAGAWGDLAAGLPGPAGYWLCTRWLSPSPPCC
jgi:hypothetical protein